MKEALIQITREAGEILLQYFHSDRPIEYEIKDDRSPVTEADKASDRYLRETL
ncbi:MAG: 3'(2'),5'-bisphosphate nucleotidase CysQ, partial [Nitrospinaceae bacterium]|nr:3'(2'),5'-bisphosphate nucleotidase CysQ [Nitrospinaceae bacterium]NIT80713.1 3'(2'),5'-bisphosphate nucleotidase CysQ [Nitrospinaceae bacterium]NIU95107.1 3'(2'),5'-bisphosphate nucleotidase CysQ [Nitrospinaceae bacterium]NIY13739.1 3'(2'),5'-bisphosphate nucleotidase CysQ [Nitrospinaceae bacterium]